ncbi:PAS domain-containing protein [Candidatus Thorarchaeota archaeon]|nr:PAS domain-containing protein [Candidatus Thorarchaeota archaeon]TFG96002.1 MAG: PAS domain-containing protein [Candidatus Thorarchaeota archaeon]
MSVTLELLEKFADNMNVGIVLVDNDDKIILFNKMAGEMLQQNPESRIGSSILRCHGEVSEKPVMKMITDLKNRVMDHYDGWVNFKGRMLYEYIYPLWNSNGEFLAIVEELHDAKEKAEYLKMKGKWQELHISGLGEKTPRSPHEKVM